MTYLEQHQPALVAEILDLAYEPCTHPLHERFVARCFTIAGPDAGELLNLCAGCGADFGPA